LSVIKEHKSTNQEIVASTGELQVLNEELTAVNSQLRETVERQRMTSDDLQNVLYSTNVRNYGAEPTRDLTGFFRS
jgi:two-component system CheB/CheR fusion protein